MEAPGDTKAKTRSAKSDVAKERNRIHSAAYKKEEKAAAAEGCDKVDQLTFPMTHVS